MRLAPSFLAECVLANSPASNDLHRRSEDQILEPEVNHNIFFPGFSGSGFRSIPFTLELLR